MDILDRINELRHERSWSIYKLAEESGIAQSTLSNMFTRKTMPSIMTLQEICNAFNISMAKFFEEKNSNNDDIVHKLSKLDEEEYQAVVKIIDIIIDNKNKF